MADKRRMTGGWLRTVGLGVVALGLLACTTRKSDGDNAAPAGSASAPDAGAGGATGGGAANEAEVTTYPDQVAAHQETLNNQMFAIVRTEASPTGGKVLAQLRPGTAVKKLAERGGFDLVLFPDMTTPGRQLEGWVNVAVFNPPPPSAPPAPPAAVVDAGGARVDAAHH